jgi:hypothetical protein
MGLLIFCTETMRMIEFWANKKAGTRHLSGKSCVYPIMNTNIPLPPRDQNSAVTLKPCVFCGAPAAVDSHDHGGRVCADHLPAEARAMYDRLRFRGWRVPAPKTRALFEAHPHGQRFVPIAPAASDSFSD